MPTTHGRTEATVLAFSRTKLAEGVHMAQVRLRRGENSTFHYHTVTRDTFFVMDGHLTIDVRVGDADPSACYVHLIDGKTAAPRIRLDSLTHRLQLGRGDVCVIYPGVVHCAMNLESDECHFLCIEGVGEYDFQEA